MGVWGPRGPSGVLGRAPCFRTRQALSPAGAEVRPASSTLSNRSCPSEIPATVRPPPGRNARRGCRPPSSATGESSRACSSTAQERVSRHCAMPSFVGLVHEQRPDAAVPRVGSREAGDTAGFFQTKMPGLSTNHCTSCGVTRPGFAEPVFAYGGEDRDQPGDVPSGCLANHSAIPRLSVAKLHILTFSHKQPMSPPFPGEQAP